MSKYKHFFDIIFICVDITDIFRKCVDNARVLAEFRGVYSKVSQSSVYANPLLMMCEPQHRGLYRHEKISIQVKNVLDFRSHQSTKSLKKIVDTKLRDIFCVFVI